MHRTDNRYPCWSHATVALALFIGFTLGVNPARAENLPAPDFSVTLPGPAANTFGVSTAFGPSDGLLYVWNGGQVLKQNAFLSDSFTSLGNVGSGSSDAGPIAFSRNGANLLVGNGFGGALGGANAGLAFSIPTAGGDSNTPVADIELHSSFLAAALGASNDKFFVNRGNDAFGTSSSVTVLDRVTGTNLPLINNIPGASTSMAVSPSGKLYVGVGYGPQRGELRMFDLSVLETAYNSATPLDWTDGQVFNSVDNNSGAGMAFDAAGNLFVGGPLGLTVFDTLGNYRLFDNGNFTAVDYDPIHNVLLITGFGNNQGLYLASNFVVPEPGTWVLAAVGALALTPVIRRRRRKR